MSYKGQYLRGEKWYHLNRDADGNLLPVITNDEEKMKDVNVYLKSMEKAKAEDTAKTKSKGKK